MWRDAHCLGRRWWVSGLKWIKAINTYRCRRRPIVVLRNIFSHHPARHKCWLYAPRTEPGASQTVLVYLVIVAGPFVVTDETVVAPPAIAPKLGPVYDHRRRGGASKDRGIFFFTSRAEEEKFEKKTSNPQQVRGRRHDPCITDGLLLTFRAHGIRGESSPLHSNAAVGRDGRSDRHRTHKRERPLLGNRRTAVVEGGRWRKKKK